MHLVIDSNALRSDDLKRYLAASPQNYAVMTDYVAMEAYKSKNISTLAQSFAIISQFPRQLIVLKNSRTIARMSGRRAGLARRLIDQGQTRSAPVFFGQLRRAQGGDKRLEEELLEMGEEARQHIDGLLVNIPSMITAFMSLADEMSDSDLVAIRKGMGFSPTLIIKLFDWMRGMIDFLADRNETPKGELAPPNLTGLFITRLSLCFALLVLHWISDGKQTATRPDKVRNDHVDMFIAAYSTYFDGVLTSDAKVKKIAFEAARILK